MKYAIAIKKFAPAGHCIYCGAVGCELTLEHIVPFGLHGRLELPSASCERCQTIINKEVEGPILGSMLRNFRIRERMPSRRKKLRQAEKPKLVFRDNLGPQEIEVEPSEYPQSIALPVFSPPTVNLNGINAAQPPESVWAWLEASGTENQLHNLANRKWHFQKINNPQFRRFIAKIAHSYTFACMDRDEFLTYEHHLPGIILGKHHSPWVYVGGDLNAAETLDLSLGSGSHSNFYRYPLAAHEVPGEKMNMHKCYVDLIRFSSHPTTYGTMWDRPRIGIENLVVRLQLFSWLSSPKYGAVVASRPLPATQQLSLQEHVQ